MPMSVARLLRSVTVLVEVVADKRHVERLLIAMALSGDGLRPWGDTVDAAGGTLIQTLHCYRYPEVDDGSVGTLPRIACFLLL